MQSLTGLDAHARAHGHLIERTRAGAIVTLLGALLALTLFANELSALTQPRRVEQMRVDTIRSSTLRLNINASFSALPCHALTVELSDAASGSHDISQHAATGQTPRGRQAVSGGRLHKWRLDRGGQHIGAHEFLRPHVETGFLFSTMMGAQDSDAFGRALEAGEGCQIEGHVEAHRMSGNFHITVAMSDLFTLPETQKKMREALQAAQTQQGLPFLMARPDTTRINVSHTIHHLSFGDEFRGQVHPLDGVTRICTTGTGTHKYFLKIVPTEYSGRGSKIQTNQFSVGEYFSPIPKGRGDMPAVFFMYDLSPIAVNISDTRPSLVHFVVRVCAVIGGVVRLTGLLNKCVHKLTVSRTMDSLLMR